MKRAKIGNGPGLAAARPARSAEGSERQYLREQVGVARTGLANTLTDLGHGLPGLIDPRRWVRHYPVAAPAVLVGTALAAGAALGRAVSRRRDAGLQTASVPVAGRDECAARVGWTRRLYATCAGMLQSAGRAVIVAALADIIRGQSVLPSGPESGRAGDEVTS
jgi:hypothetical protein